MRGQDCCHEMSKDSEPGLEHQSDRLRVRVVHAVERMGMHAPPHAASGAKSFLRQAKRNLKPMLSITSILIILSHSVPLIKRADCYQLISSPSRYDHRHQQGVNLQPPPYDASQLATISSDTAHLLPVDPSELPGEQVDWPRKLKLHAASAMPTTSSNKFQSDLIFAPTIEQEEALTGVGTNSQQDDSLNFSNQSPPALRPQIHPLIMPKLANLLLAANQQPSALKNLINSTLPQTNLGRAIEATRMFVRQQQESVAASQLTPRVPLIQVPGTVSNRLYNFLFQPRAHQHSTSALDQDLSESLASRKQNTSESSTTELIQSAESQESALPGEKVGSGRSLVTLSAPYEERPRKMIATGQMRKIKEPIKSVNLMPSASGRHSFATTFSKPNTATSWIQASNKTFATDEIVPNVTNETHMIDSIDPQQSEQRPQQQFVVGSEESEGDQQEHEQQQVSTHLQNQDQANAEFQASLQNSHDEEANQNLQADQQSADQPQELIGYIEQPQQSQQQQLEQDIANSPGELEPENQAIEYGHNESIYLTPGSQRYTNNNLTTNMLVPINETDLTPTSVANLQGDDTSLAAQLPSQYDSMIRLPPDGHYDDYFKPGGAGVNPNNNNMFASEQLTSGTSSLMSHQETSALQPQEFFTPYSVVSANQNHTQRQHEPQLTSSNGKFNLEGTQQLRQQQQQQQQHMNANFQPTILANNATPLDYTIQYYMNQQPLKPNTQSTPAQTIEFVTANQSSLPHLELPNHKIHQDVEPQRHMRSKQSHPMTPSTNSSMASIDQANQSQVSSGLNDTTDEYQPAQSDASGSGQPMIANNGEYHLWNYSTTSTPESNQTEDSIQLIVANSNGFQDPHTNERIITYSSEGRNFTQPNGKSARNTFFNKDLNELPADQKNPELPPNGTEKLQTHELMLQIRPKLRSTRSPSVEDNPNNHRVLVLVNKQPPQQQQQQYRIVATTTQTPQTAGTERTGTDDDEHDHDESSGYSSSDSDEQEVIVQPGQYAQFGERQQREVSKPKQSSQQNSRTSYPRENRDKSQNPRTGARVRDHEQARPPRTYRSKSSPPPQTSGGSDRMHQQHHHGRFKNSNHGMKHQQTIRRPQVTEAKFQLKDLALNAPTAMPSVAESTMRSIESMPTKVKQIRDKQVDKNELMNELLTALDRVKAAIYKLQPLTAKMNAMYRKSVTSNTRDHIMDNHKGTYSKRYPPGDYDDTYDRMHPSELIDRQREQRSSRRRRGDRSRNKSHDEVHASDSKITPVYLPAPRDFNTTASNTSSLDTMFQKRHNSSQLLSLDDAETKTLVVASGVGHRLGANGHRMRGRLSFKTASGDQQIIYDDDVESDLSGLDLDNLRSVSNAETVNGTSQSFSRRNGSQLIDNEVPRSLSDQEVQSPLFGYKITIYQSPEDSDTGTGDTDDLSNEQNQLLSYTLLSDATSPELSFNTNANSEPAYELAATEDDSSSSATESDGVDLMATSESSLAPTQTDDMDGSESSKKKKKSGMGEEKKHKKSMEEEKKHKVHDKKEKADKKGGKWAKHQAKHKKGEEEHKKKKEFKKIKHSKGVMSKESHKLHRDKHIKAHDRGAAKEKALKERTQIEFFEREQIVDDEFEKGKKSTMKAGWASGHDAKKVDKELHGGGHGGDSMSMGGSHYVKHVETPPPGMMTSASEHGDSGYLEKGHGHTMETSSGKQSNKFEKKHMEAKGKKFKGWREKGYKIITETEFIDRGSLHDSAYKKRDKGAAHHQKFKKHEANSEGHHGSMHEHHKKSHKKEEKKSKMEEKKKEIMGKEKGEKIGKHKKAKKKEIGDKKHKHHEEKEHHGDHDQEESSPTMASIASASGQQIDAFDEYDSSSDDANVRLPKSDASSNTTRLDQSHPTIMMMGSSTLRPTVLPLPMTSTRANQPAIMRFLPTDHQDHTQNGPTIRTRGEVNLAKDQNRAQEAHANIATDTANMSRRSDNSAETDSSVLVDVMNRLRSSQQMGKSEMRSEPARVESSPLLKLIHGLSRTNNTWNMIAGQSSMNPPASESQKYRDRGSAATNSRDEPDMGLAKFDGATFNNSIDRIKLVLAHLGQNRLHEQVRRASNLNQDQYNSMPRQAPFDSLRLEATRPFEAVGNHEASELGLLSGFVPQSEQRPVIQQPVYQPRMQAQPDPSHSLLPRLYPFANVFPQQVADAPNRMEPMDHFDALEFGTDQMSVVAPSTYVNSLSSNQGFFQLPFGGHLIT